MNQVCTTNTARGARVAVDDLVFVACPAESVFLLNLSEGGMAVQAMDILNSGESLPFSFALPGGGDEVQGTARIAWADRSGRAGLQFVGLSGYDRFRLAQWVVHRRDN